MIANNELTRELFAFARSEDMDVFGVLPLTFDDDQAKIGRRQKDLYPDMKSLILFGCGHVDPLTKSWAQECLVGDVNSIAINELILRSYKLKRFLRQKGYRAITDTLDTHGLLNLGLRMNVCFERAGLGYTGKSNLFITPKYGPRLNLLMLGTDAELSADAPPIDDDCGNCTLCQKVCTSGAILGDGYFHPRQCEAVVNCKPNQMLFSKNGWYDCDMCYRMCPKGELKWTKHDRRHMNWYDLLDDNRKDVISSKSIFRETTDEEA